MNEVKLPSGETVYYLYDPRADGLDIRLRPGAEATAPEPLEGAPNVQVRRDKATGEVVAVVVQAVQSLILDHLVRDLVAQALFPAAAKAERKLPETPPEARPLAAEPPEPPQPAASAGPPLVYDDTEEAAFASPPRRRRRRRRRRNGGAPETQAAAATAAAGEAASPEPATKAPASTSPPPEGREPPRAHSEPPPDGGQPLSVSEPPAADSARVETSLEPTTPTAVEPEPSAPTVESGAGAAAVVPPASITPAPAAFPWPPIQLVGDAEAPSEEPQASTPAPPAPAAPDEMAAAAEADVASEAEGLAGTDEGAAAPAAEGLAGTDEGAVAPAAEGLAATAEEPSAPQRSHGLGPGDSAPVADGAGAEASGADEQDDEDPELAAITAHVAAEPVPEGLAPAEGFGFLGLDERLGQAVAALGFEAPTPIQRRAIPPAMAGRDLVGLAQTGTGKTAAFLLPALHRLLANEDTGHRTRVLVVTPTRELAVQVGAQAVALARFTPLRVAVVYGGAGMRSQISALRRGADVVVATPGRLLDHVGQRNLRLDAVEVLVLDESDRMLDMGFIPDIRRIIGMVPDGRQTFLFGATLPPDIEQLTRRFQREPEMVEVARQLPPETLEQELYPVGRHLKLPLLVHLLKSDPDLSKVMVFAETKNETDIVARQLLAAGLKVASMHGDRPQRDRERALDDLKSGRVQVLVATNVAARGLDIEDVTHVVNYDMPQTVDEYIHRVGRTARGAGTEGTAVSFVTMGDETMVRRIESALERELPRLQAEGFDYDVPTPSWAQPSAQDLSKAMSKPSLSNLSRSFRGGFRRKRR